MIWQKQTKGQNCKQLNFYQLCEPVCGCCTFCRCAKWRRCNTLRTSWQRADTFWELSHHFMSVWRMWLKASNTTWWVLSFHLTLFFFRYFMAQPQNSENNLSLLPFGGRQFCWWGASRQSTIHSINRPLGPAPSFCISSSTNGQTWS